MPADADYYSPTIAAWGLVSIYHQHPSSQTRKSIFFFNDTATTEIYTLSLHDALPIYFGGNHKHARRPLGAGGRLKDGVVDRKSTRLNSSHLVISYAVFCLKKKNRE